MALLKDLFRNVGLILDSHTILLAVVIFLLLFFIAQRYLFRVKNLPSGPKSWPLLGCVPELMYLSRTAKTIEGLFNSLHQKYGPVCCLSLPFPLGKKIIIINGYRAIHESLVSPDFNQRPSMKLHGQADDLLDGEGE